MKEKLCTSHCNNYDQLEQTIINFLKINYLNFIDKNKIMDNIKEKLNSLNAIDNKMFFLVPLYNSAQCMNEIFSLKCNLLDCTIPVSANLVYTLIMVWILTKMFKSERIML